MTYDTDKWLIARIPLDTEDSAVIKDSNGHRLVVRVKNEHIELVDARGVDEPTMLAPYYWANEEVRSS